MSTTTVLSPQIVTRHLRAAGLTILPSGTRRDRAGIRVKTSGEGARIVLDVDGRSATRALSDEIERALAARPGWLVERHEHESDENLRAWTVSRKPTRGTTPLRAVRIDEDLWSAAQERAAAQGENVSDVIRAALRLYVS